MTRLVYVGPAPGSGILPLPEGWPPFDHEEPDTRAAALKVQSGFYRAEGADDGNDQTSARRRAAREKED